MKRIVIWLPWVLLIIVISSFFVWQQKQESTRTVAADGVKMEAEKLDPLVQQAPQGGVMSYNQAVKAAAPAVVSIFVESKYNKDGSPDEDIFRDFFNNFGNGMEKNEDAASGVIIREDGYILTNAHVVKNAERIVVALNDDRRIEAKLIGQDDEIDLAVIKVELTGLPVIPLKLSENQIGDVVLAIGNPFGLGQTVTQGIISAIDRSDLGINAYENFIQTDAAINPGNSGGALIDVSGNLIGINTAIFSRSGGSMGIGFAIPANTAKQAFDSIIENGRVVRGWLGISLMRKSGNDDSLMYDHAKAITNYVVEDGPAGLAGMKTGDQILKFNGIKIKTPTHLINVVAGTKPNITVPIEVKRGDEILTFNVKILDRQEYTEEQKAKADKYHEEKARQAMKEFIPLPSNQK